MAHYRSLTAWEVEEFVEEVSIRPVLWFGKGHLWVRRREGEHQFAVKFVKQSDHKDLYTVYVRVLNVQPQEEVDRYVDWLLTRLTSLGERLRIQRYLEHRLIGWDEGGSTDFEEMAIEICRPHGVQPAEAVEEPSVCVEAQEPSRPTTQEVRAPTVRRSRYLQNLLKGSR